MEPSSRLTALCKDREKSELETIAGLKRRLEAAVSSLQALKTLPVQPLIPRPKPLYHSPSAGLLLAQVQGDLAALRQRERGRIETEYQRKALDFDLGHPSLRPLPKAPSSERPSLTPSEGHLSRYPTATSLLSPKSTLAPDQRLQKDLKIALSRSQTQENTLIALKLAQESLEKRLFALENQGKEEKRRENSEGREGKDRKYIQEWYLIRKRREQDRAWRLLEREKAWRLDLEGTEEK